MELSFDGQSVTDVGVNTLLATPALVIDRGEVLAGRYQIEEIIGRGGSGLVLRAFDRIAQMLVAVKILKSELAADPHWVDRFSRELRLARQIQHPNVCRVFDIGEADGHRFLTMELASGGTLRDTIRPGAPERTWEQRLADARALVDGLAAIHAAGVIHRDIKPENLLRMEDGRLVLTDFGLATNPTQVPSVTVLVGTPAYMAPEMVMGDPANMRSDVWALGVTMHEILFGKRPEWRLMPNGERSFQSPVPKSGGRIEKALARLCAACASEAPLRRPGDAQEVHERFAAIENGGPTRRDRRRGVRRTVGWAVLAVGVASALTIARSRLWVTAQAALSGRPAVRSAEVIGRPADWRKTAKRIAAFDEVLRCVSRSPDGPSLTAVWGNPARAEQIDLATGRRSPAPWLPETFELGCPQPSPDGSRLLFERMNAARERQIAISRKPDGSEAQVLTAGSEPHWLPSGEEFVFDIDALHAAVYSLPVRSLSMVPEPAPGTVGLVEKAVSAKGDRLALAYLDRQMRTLVVIRALPSLELVDSFRPEGGTLERLAFGNDSDLQMSISEPTVGSSLVRLFQGSLVRIGTSPGAALREHVAVLGGTAVVTETSATTVTWTAGKHLRRLTVSGHLSNGSVSRTGRLIAQRTIDDRGLTVIELYDPDGTKPVARTDGPNDVTPAFLPGTDEWAYARTNEKSIVRCPSDARCEPLVQDPLLPVWPVFSPDGSRMAFVTVTGVPRTKVLDLNSRQVFDVGPSRSECAPIWTERDRFWALQGSDTDRQWTEYDALTLAKTGAHRTAGPPPPDGDQMCAIFPTQQQSPIQVAQRTTTELLRVPWAP